jgi:hypothetical protein
LISNLDDEAHIEQEGRKKKGKIIKELGSEEKKANSHEKNAK